MDELAGFSNDFDFAHGCLQGDAEAIALLQAEFGEIARCYLLKAGAEPAEAQEIIQGLWADLLVSGPNRVPRLVHYHGNCALSTWLNTVALNELISRKRREQRWQAILPGVGLEPSSPAAKVIEEAGNPSEVPIIALMREAIEVAFADCGSEDFVLLQLAHCDRLQGQEMARIFQCSGSAITRRLEAAEETMARRILEFVRQRDPWLELRWEDFRVLCRAATPACFGQEA